MWFLIVVSSKASSLFWHTGNLTFLSLKKCMMGMLQSSITDFLVCITSINGCMVSNAGLSSSSVNLGVETPVEASKSLHRGNITQIPRQDEMWACWQGFLRAWWDDVSLLATSSSTHFAPGIASSDTAKTETCNFLAAVYSVTATFRHSLLFKTVLSWGNILHWNWCIIQSLQFKCQSPKKRLLG